MENPQKQADKCEYFPKSSITVPQQPISVSLYLDLVVSFFLFIKRVTV